MKKPRAESLAPVRPDAQDKCAEPPLGKAIVRVMRAIMFDDKPQPELDALPMAQLRLMMTVYYGGEATMKDYSERLLVSQSTLTQLAERLVRRGLIERYPDEADRRVVRLRISDAGRELMSIGDKKHRQTVAAVWDRLSEAQRAAAMDILETLGQIAEDEREKQGRPVPHWPGFDKDKIHKANGAEPSASQPVMDILACKFL
jgi:DNA-binding MarR family transcriptional regulator